MFIAAAIAVIITGIQAGFFYWQLKQMGKATRREIEMRRHHSIYSISKKFEAEVDFWVNQPAAVFSADDMAVTDKLVAGHNESLHRLTPYVDYLEEHHRDIYLGISEAWGLYHGGDVHRPIHRLIYYTDGQRTERGSRAYWIGQLFRIINTLESRV